MTKKSEHQNQKIVSEKKEHTAETKTAEGLKSASAIEENTQTPAAEESKEALLQQKNKELEDKYLRLYAEFDNFRKRTQLEKEEFAKYAAAETVKNLLPLMDSFERAKSSFEKHTEDIEELKKGMALIHKQFEDILEKIGVSKIAAKGAMFDPNLHEAIMQQDAEGVEPQTVIEEVQPGFVINDKVLRHAMVIVAK